MNSSCSVVNSKPNISGTYISDIKISDNKFWVLMYPALEGFLTRFA